MADWSDAKCKAVEWIEASKDRLAEINDLIWEYAEPGLLEFKSAELLIAELKQHGFDVTEGTAGMPTGFVATWGETGPVIGLMAEYDAIPGNSQQRQPYHAPIAPHAGGFPDLHNGIGTASVMAAIAVKQALEATGTPGRVKIVGTPAEKLCVGKPFQARDGLYDDFDAVVAWHPRAYTTCEWDTGPGCYRAVAFTFKGMSTYGAKPWTGVSALDAMTLMNVIVQFMREHIPREYLASVNELVTVGGYHPTSLPEHTEIWYVHRSPEIDGIRHVEAMLSRAANAAAQALGATVEERVLAATRPWLPNHTMARLCYDNLQLVGAPGFSEEDKAFGREIFRNLGKEAPAEPFDETLTPPESGISVEFAGGADDVTEFCWHAPTARIYVAYMLQPGNTRLPNWANAALAATGIAHETVRVAARAMACSVLDLMTRPEVLREAQEEFRRRTQGQMLPVQVPPGVEAPVDLPLPTLHR